MAPYRALLLCALVASGCDDDDGGRVVDADGDAGPGSDTDAGPDTLFGDWNIVAGEILPGLGIDAESLSYRFDADGNGRVVFRAFGLENCLPIYAAVGDDRLAVDFAASAIPLARIYTISHLDGDSLTLFDDEGHVLLMERPTDDSPAPACESLEQLALIDDLPKPVFGYGSDLEFDGTDLFYVSDVSDDDGYLQRSVDPDTGEVTNIELNGDVFISAWKSGGQFWTLSGSGGNTDTDLIDSDSLNDTVDTTDLGEPINIGGMAADGNTIYLQGTNADGSLLLKVATGSEPDILTDTVELPATFTTTPSLAFDGSSLWALHNVVTTVLVQIDPDSGELLGHWQVADQTARWSNVAVEDGRMFLLGVVDASSGRIIEVTPPE
jgi:hypothetical protein